MNKKNEKQYTEEERQKIISVLNIILPEDEWPNEPTEYDVLMRRKRNEFITYLFDMDDGNFLINLNSEEFASHFTIAVMYDMWLNESRIWPVGHNPKWEEWEKLKEIKVNISQK